MAGSSRHLVEAVHTLFETGVMQASGHGNASIRLDDDRMIITSKSVLRNLGAEHLAVVTFGGDVLEGEMDPAVAEIVRMHAQVYQLRRDVGSVIHTHSPYATAFAIANKPIPCAYESLLRQGVTTSVPVAAWAPR